MNQIPFAELNLTAPIRRAIEDMGFENATDIQAQSIPILQEGRDLIGRSQTGTGKTIAFAVPAIESIDTGENKNNVQVIILCPTRELAMQACSEIRKLTKYVHGVKAVDIYGGASMNTQIIALKRGTNIVVGTPGRIMDHMRRRTLKLEHVKMVVLDEADEMLSMGFKEDIETILKDIPKQHQTVLFSATMPPSILELTKQFQNDPVMIEINKKQPSVKAIAQCYFEVPMGRKMEALSLILKHRNPNRAMIFCNTKKMTEEVAKYLTDNGFHAEALNGDMKQMMRTKVLSAFKQGRTNVLVATDVAARGIDVEDIDYVINYDIPQNIEYYIHRIGRTGRAGKSGNAITLCSGRKQVILLNQIARLVKSEIIHDALPNRHQIAQEKEKANRKLVEDALCSAVDYPYMEMVEELKETGYSAEQIAASVLLMHFGKMEDDISEEPLFKEEVKRSGRGRNGKMAKISLNIGRAMHAAPNHIVGAITEFTSLIGADIGKIEIYDNKTVVSVPQDDLDQVLEDMSDCKICGHNVTASEYIGSEREGYFPRHIKGAKDYRRLDMRKPRYQSRGKRDYKHD
jgi:ATP-dependent RNA helicase DeaD